MTHSILTVLLFVAPIVVESGRFNIMQNGQRVGTEEFSIAPRGTGYVVEGKTQLSGDHVPLTSRMELDAKLNPTSYEYKQGSATLRLNIGQPLSELKTGANGKEESTEFRFPSGGAIIDNNFFHHYLLLLYRMSESGTLPVFVPQDMRQGQAVIRSTGNRAFSLEIGDVKLEATTDANGRLMRLTVPEAKVVIER